MFSKILLVIIVLILSWINNLFIPLFLYHRKYGLFRKKYKGGGGCNGWSFVMDGLLAGLMNIVVTNFLLEIGYHFSVNEIVIALGMGALLTFISHVTMSLQKWDIWIMPKPWKWNGAGYWHMISMTLQTGYFFLVLIALFSNKIYISKDSVISTLVIFSITLSFFLWSFFQKDKGLKIGKFHINKEAW